MLSAHGEMSTHRFYSSTCLLADQRCAQFACSPAHVLTRTSPRAHTHIHKLIHTRSARTQRRPSCRSRMWRSSTRSGANSEVVILLLSSKHIDDHCCLWCIHSRHAHPPAVGTRSCVTVCCVSMRSRCSLRRGPLHTRTMFFIRTQVSPHGALLWHSRAQVRHTPHRQLSVRDQDHQQGAVCGQRRHDRDGARGSSPGDPPNSISPPPPPYTHTHTRTHARTYTRARAPPSTSVI